MRKLACAFLTIDPRTLALTRILLGLLLLTDLAKRTAEISIWYTNDGLIPNHRMLWRPLNDWTVSYLLGLSTSGQVAVALVLTAGVYLAFLAGWRTRTMHILSWLCLVALHARTSLISTGGDYVLGELMLWTAFLPLGQRFSLDALAASLRAGNERDVSALRARSALPRLVQPVRSLAVFGAMSQLAVIYFFNAVHKQGVTWQDGSAVHYLLHQTRIVTPLGVWLGAHAPASLLAVFSSSTVVIEYAAPLLILSPWGRPFTRRVAIVLLVGLHLGIAAVSNLGLFSPTMIVFVSLLVSSEDWARLTGWLREHTPTCRFVIDGCTPLAFQFARLCCRLDVLSRLEVYAPHEIAHSDIQAVVARNGWATLSASGARIYSGRAALAQVLAALPCGAMLTGFAYPLAPLLAPVRGAAIAKYFGLDAATGRPQPADSSALRMLRRTAIVLGELGVVFVMIVATSQTLVENPAIAQRLPVPQPSVLQAAVGYLRLKQGWSLFAPDAPTRDMIVVVDAVTIDGRHVDPYNLLASRLADPALRSIPERLGQNVYFCAYTQRLPDAESFHEMFGDWIMRHHLRTAREKDRIRSFTAYIVEHDSPRPGERAPSHTRTSVFLRSRPSEWPPARAQLAN